MIDNEYSRQTDLGILFGVSSHVIGEWLAALGLRNGRYPTTKARELGLVKAVTTERGEASIPFYIWHTAKTVRLLEEAGHRQVQLPKQEPAAVLNVLVGPFSRRNNGANSHEVLNGNGDIFCWVSGEKAADWVVRLLNLANRHGKFA